uniref:Uncharacterized protein n=1 Tax=Romanomermis culicivorax TaxID=13658 RepID=A0A915IXJ1_ROMCU
LTAKNTIEKAGTSGGSAVRPTENASVAVAGAYPKPDVNQMLPFKPKIITTSSYHPVAGGIFPPPPAVAHLMSLLPPPYSFNGPFVGVDVLAQEGFKKRAVKRSGDSDDESGLDGQLPPSHDIYRLRPSVRDKRNNNEKIITVRFAQRKNKDKDIESEFSNENCLTFLENWLSMSLHRDCRITYDCHFPAAYRSNNAEFKSAFRSFKHSMAPSIVSCLSQSDDVKSALQKSSFYDRVAQTSDDRNSDENKEN